ncbi:MAG: hypothetical protein ACI9M3_000860, partial [Bacteroidia bacterium]
KEVAKAFLYGYGNNLCPSADGYKPSLAILISNIIP